MKKLYMLSALLSAAVFFSGCIKENFVKPVPANDGDEVVFGARAGFESKTPGTKTVYTGETYTENGKTFEHIDWVTGEDMIEISCPQAKAVTTSHYLVNSGTDQSTQETFAYLTKNEDVSLQWNGDEPHDFYAMYPSSKMFGTETTLNQGIYMEGTVLHGYVPAAQPAVDIVDEGDGKWVAKPDMKYAYMAARSTASRTDGNVSLSFVPVVTAVEVELVLEGSGVQSLLIGEIQVSGSGIAGGFTADLSEDAWTGAYPTCVNSETDGADIITLTVYKDSKPVTLASGQSLKFTVFLRPGADYSNLKVSFSPNGAGYVGKTLQGVTIPKNLKTRISKLLLPQTAIIVDASNWMSQLDPATKLHKLSLPGTGGSFSYNYNGSNSGWYKQQTLTFEQQWQAGIRAFEIVSDRPSSANTSLGTEYVKCNKQSMEVTVLNVLQDLLTWVATPKEGETDPSECAVLILTYQPEGDIGVARNASTYASCLKKMYDGLTADQKKQIIQYTPQLTLGEAMGKVMIFCRINQKDEDDDGSFADATTTLSGTNITLIDGCGTGKDRWGSRGYKVQGDVAYDAANTSDASKSVDYYLTERYSGFADWSNVTVPVAANGDLNFAFPTNYTDVTCWYQEWARVVPSALVGSNGFYEVSDYRWHESYSEKLAAAEETFKMAISDKYSSDSAEKKYVFINSLCGYFVDSSISSSYTVFTGSNTGGIAGNIKALADEINPAFYQYVLQAGLDQTTGPTGIVMMDYVTNQPNSSVEYDGSYLLPGVIIANNFKFANGNSGDVADPDVPGDTNTPGGGTEEDGI